MKNSVRATANWQVKVLVSRGNISNCRTPLTAMLGHLTHRLQPKPAGILWISAARSNWTYTGQSADSLPQLSVFFPRSILQPLPVPADHIQRGRPLVGKYKPCLSHLNLFLFNASAKDWTSILGLTLELLTWFSHHIQSKHQMSAHIFCPQRPSFMAVQHQRSHQRRLYPIFHWWLNITEAPQVL